MRKSGRFQRRRNNKGRVMIVAVFISLLLVMLGNSYRLQGKYDDYKKRETALQQQIEVEEERTEEIEEFRKYAQTKKYIEEQARDKLGLVYEDEIIFKAE